MSDVTPTATTTETTTKRRRRPVAVTQADLGMFHDVAVLGGWSERTVKRMVADAVIPGVCRPYGRQVRFHLPTVRQWLAEGCPKRRRR